MGSPFIAQETRCFCRQNGVVNLLSVPLTPQYNGSIERPAQDPRRPPGRPAVMRPLVQRHPRIGSLWACEHANGKQPMPDAWPVERPRDWVRIVNQTMEKEQLDPIRISLRRGRPLGSERWVKQTAAALGLDFTLRERGRPKKPSDDKK